MFKIVFRIPISVNVNAIKSTMASESSVLVIIEEHSNIKECVFEPKIRHDQMQESQVRERKM